MMGILGIWAVFTLLNLSAQEILRIILYAVSSRNAVFAVWSETHALLLTSVTAGIGAAAASLPFLRQIRWETGFPGSPPGGVASNRTVRILLSGLFGAVAAQIGAALLLGAVPGNAFMLKAQQTPWDQPGGGIPSVWDLGTMSIVYGVLTPVIEELVFRGLLLGRLQRLGRMRPFGANLLSAFLFALYHGSLPAGLYAFPVGLLLGDAALQTRSVWTPILLHGLINLTMLQLSYRAVLPHLCYPAWFFLFTVLAILARLLPE